MDSQDNTVGQATKFEVIKKATGEIFPVQLAGSGDEDGDGDNDFIVLKLNSVDQIPAELVFTRPGFLNDEYFVRRVEDKMLPDGSAVVEDVQAQ